VLYIATGAEEAAEPSAEAKQEEFADAGDSYVDDAEPETPGAAVSAPAPAAAKSSPATVGTGTSSFLCAWGILCLSFMHPCITAGVVPNHTSIHDVFTMAF
jgi:hypothetical protein